MNEIRDERILFKHMSKHDYSVLSGVMRYWARNTHRMKPANNHVVDRIRQKHITMDEVLLAVAQGEYIEFHVYGNRPRVLVRHKRQNQSNDVCVVFDVKTGRIITAYTNDSSDNHKTLREELYNMELNVLTTLKECGMFIS